MLIFLYQRKHQKKMKNKQHVKISKDFSGVDLNKLQENYDILNKLLDDINTLNNEKTNS